METIKQILNVPDNHQLHFDVTLPKSFPIGLTEVLLIFASKNTLSLPVNKDIFKLAGVLKDSKNFAGDALAIQKGLRDEWER